uniref:Uncharacterized protein n=1 Tax=Arundo donax TaxID=35708 RepID=A0A0A8YLU5_ARUDO
MNIFKLLLQCLRGTCGSSLPNYSGP